jgi:hypothetical protein
MESIIDKHFHPEQIIQFMPEQEEDLIAKRQGFIPPANPEE